MYVYYLLIDFGKCYWLLVYKLCDLIFDYGKGVWVWDIEGCEYVDFGVGIVVNVFGYVDFDFIVVLMV